MVEQNDSDNEIDTIMKQCLEKIQVRDSSL